MYSIERQTAADGQWARVVAFEYHRTAELVLHDFFLRNPQTRYRIVEITHTNDTFTAKFAARGRK